MDLREQIAKAAAPPSEDVTIEGVTFRMVGLGAFDQLALTEISDTDATFWVLERMVRDMNGARVFADDDPVLRGLRIEVLNELSEVAVRLMDPDNQAKNSEAALSSGG